MSEIKNKEQNSLWLNRVAISKDERTRWEAFVSTCMGFADGRQKQWYDMDGGFHVKEEEDHEVFRTVNLINSHLSIHISRLTANDPRWHPVSSEGMKLSRVETDVANAILQDVWEGEPYGDDSFKFTSKLNIRYGFLQGRDLAYIHYDEQYQRPCVQRFDMWDVYSDPSSQSLREKQWLDIALPKGVTWLKQQKSEGWNEELLKLLNADHILAESGIKSSYIQSISGGNARGRDTVLTHYTFEVDPESGAIIHRVVVPTMGAGEDDEEGVLFKQTIEPYDEDHPMRLSDVFDSFAPVETGRFYERPVVFDWIDPQKTINKMYSGIENYIDCFIQGKWVLRDEDVDVPRAGTHGQKIIGDPQDVQAIQLQPLPSTHFEHLSSAIAQLEQISGVHSESMGRQSGGAESGVAIAQLQALDEQNSADAVDNFKQYLGRVGLKVLNNAAQHWTEQKKVYAFDKMNKTSKVYNVIGYASSKGKEGEEGAEGEGGMEPQEDLVVLHPFKKLDIEIVIGQFFLASQKREEIRSLFESGWTPGENPVKDRAILSTYDIGVGRELVDELEKMQNPDLMIAYGKSAKIANGDDVPVHPDDDHQFLADFYTERAAEMKELGFPKAEAALMAKAEEHQAMLQEQSKQAAPNEEVTPPAEPVLDPAADPAAAGGAVPPEMPGMGGMPPPELFAGLDPAAALEQ